MSIFFKNKKSRVLLFSKNKKSKIGIAFGGGGARGFAHLGVIKAFEEYGISSKDFSMIVGTSAGSIIGAFYAAGYTFSQMMQVAKNVDKSEIKTNRIPFMPSKTDGIQEIIKKHLGDINIEDLPHNYACVACDIKSTKEIVLKKGNLAKAIAGSCCVPGVFVPVVFNNYHLCDGGLKNTIPTNVPKKFGCDYVIGVDVNKHRTYGTDSLKVIDVASCSIRILMENTALRGYLHADVMIGPETKRFSASKTEGMMDMVEEGYKEAIDKMPEILKILNKKPQKNKTKKHFMEEEIEIND